MNKRKSRIYQQLLESFGKLKEDSFDFDTIECYFRKKKHSKEQQVLSDKTCADLDFNEFFTFLDRTQSRVGQQYLYNKLRCIPETQDTNLQEKIIQQFIEDACFRTEIQYYLQFLNHDQASNISALFQDPLTEKPKWFSIVPVLAFLAFACLLFLFKFPLLIFVLIPVLILNLIIHYWNKQNLYSYLSSLPELFKLTKIAGKIHKKQLLSPLDSDLESKLYKIRKLKFKMLVFNLEVKVQGDMEAVFWFPMELLKICFLIEPLFLFGVLKKLNLLKQELEDIYCLVGETDALLSVASLRKGVLYYCKPGIIREDKKITIQEVFHPLIPDCITNSLSVQGKSVLLTGSNMSGKTSFIRTIGLNVISGLTLNTCFARQFEMPNLKVYSAIRISDDLLNNKSYYFEEVTTIGTMLEESKNSGSWLFLLDEIFKGTNTIERVAAGKAVLSALNKGSNLVFVSTHDIELADFLKDEYDLYHFSELVDQQNVDFDFTLKPGKLTNRNAIRILEINGYPKEIIEEALQISASLDKR